ncbi:YhcH/YjgK/YiaL family protein [Sulfurimonas sp.]|jgi:YhcH/YjgK/YiaL family protein|uniref:YhcH/YjgK/YiaL family protein n=1 Tax=Sulfurimonas sp. TaxID=2022749 RepID=UPI0025EDFC2C|nr:YhcH/YjgK/YiaL family protein [Sulfurimonas sp.]MCK9473258.1 YhcH/YjgK/YiaL family protein [Sulfurimonas sp.]MDD3505419.1 YhcH/YjgK/YiaL family protein [Sulfurimonas sp.]
MIVDKLKNYQIYKFGTPWQRAFEFLNSITHETEDGRYEIDGENIFAIVMSYKTIPREKAIIESHKNYVDIQTTLRGTEGFECFFIDSLKVKTPYDTSKDAEFYENDTPYHSRSDIPVGSFIMFYPHDAHMPCLIVGGKDEYIKKVVVKIRVELL